MPFNPPRGSKHLPFQATAYRRDADDLEGSSMELVVQSRPHPFVTNGLGDIFGRRSEDDTVEPFDPDKFGWPRQTRPENRRSLDQIETLPGFSLTVEPGPQFVPGPRPKHPKWFRWKNGAAPPAAVESRGGIGGIHGHRNRLTDALGDVARLLPTTPEMSPFIVHDLIGGRRMTIQYQAPPLEPGGRGTVYVLDDGDAFKIGYTNGYVAARVCDLQTGNPRLIRRVAEVRSVPKGVEEHLQTEFGQWSLRGEWFGRQPLEELAADVGGWDELLRLRLPPGEWDINIFDANP